MNNTRLFFILFLIGILISPVSTCTKQKKSFSFQFENEDIVNIINLIAAEKEINIVLPQGGNALTQKVTFSLENKITIDEAWKLLQVTLDVADYSIVPQNNLYIITPNSADISREPMPIYIGTPFDKLPDSEQRIRYMYYLANMRVSEEANSELAQMFKTLMPPDNVFKIDPSSNALIIAGKSSDIKAIMGIVVQLDKVGFHEKMEIFKLRHTESRIVADLFNQQILRAGGTELNRYRLDTKKQNDAYFSPFTRVIAEERTNSLIILGRTQAVERITDFIQQYIDIKPDSGQSILHVYQLQYLDAVQMETVLKNIVSSAKTGGTEQSTAAGAASGGIERYFDEVIIKADRPEQAPSSEKQEELSRYYGGNKLIIAARNEDWKRIKILLEKLDKPQPQVLIEVLIADITIEEDSTLGAQTRNPANLPLPSQVNIQAAQLGQVILNGATVPPASTVAADLLGNVIQPNNTNLAQAANPGTTVVSLSDNNGTTWSLLEMLKDFGDVKIISHPHVISTNNQPATVRIGQKRLVVGAATYGNPAATTIQNEWIEANLTVQITPRISAADLVNVTIKVEIQSFLPGNTNNAKTNRIVTTNANIKDKGILALGGLIAVSANDALAETPWLARIPILGWFFKERTNSVEKNNLTVFISPTIIQPHFRQGISTYTTDYIKIAKNYAQASSLFDSLRDPITRWFFKTESDTDEIIDNFIEKDDVQREKVQAQGRKARKETRKQERIALHDKQEKIITLKSLLDDDNPLLTVSPRQHAKHLQS